MGEEEGGVCIEVQFTSVGQYRHDDFVVKNKNLILSHE